MKPLIYEVSSGNLETKFGEFKIHYFSDGREDALALVAGDIHGAKNVLCRIHSQCLLAEAFYSEECDCSVQMERALKNLQRQGGILIYLFQNGRGHGLAPLIATQDLKRKGMDQQDAYKYTGFFDVKRSFDLAAKILLYFNIDSIRLITKNKDKFKDIQKYGISVTNAGMDSSVIIFEKNIRHIISSENMVLMPVTNKTIVIISDLNVDNVFYLETNMGISCAFAHEQKTSVGGCAFNSACIFKKNDLDPIILGSVGKDPDGDLILSDLEKHALKAFIYKSDKNTGRSEILYENGIRKINSQPQNANEYDSKIAVMMSSLRVDRENLVYITAHLLFRGEKKNIFKIRDAIYQSKANIVVDIVPHNIYTWATWDFLCEVFNQPLFMVICELNTLLSLIPRLDNFIGSEEAVDEHIFTDILEKVYDSNLNSEYLVFRYGYENIGKQRVYKKSGKHFKLYADKKTGFETLSSKDRLGYGEVLTVQLLKEYFYEGTI